MLLWSTSIVVFLLGRNQSRNPPLFLLLVNDRNCFGISLALLIPRISNPLLNLPIAFHTNLVTALELKTTFTFPYGLSQNLLLLQQHRNISRIVGVLTNMFDWQREIYDTFFYIKPLPKSTRHHEEKALIQRSNSMAVVRAQFKVASLLIRSWRHTNQ